MKKYLLALLMLAIFLPANLQAAQMIQIKGSDTMINLVQKLAEEYMKKNPGKIISVTGGGSGTGIAAIINRKCDLANSSRPMKQSEITQAVQRGGSPKRIMVAMDGVTIVVNQKNVVKQLTMDQLGKIYRGEITNWKQVGGKDVPISLFGRQSNSGTYGFFAEVVLKGEYSQKMMMMNGSSQIVEAVKQDEGGIGYVGVGYAKASNDVSVVNIAAKENGYYSSPLNQDDVDNGKYPIARPLNQYVNGMPAGELKDFIAFELSDEGQKIVEEEGFFKLPSVYVKNNKETVGI